MTSQLSRLAKGEEFPGFDSYKLSKNCKSLSDISLQPINEKGLNGPARFVQNTGMDSWLP